MDKPRKCKGCGLPLPPDTDKCPVCKWQPSTMFPRKAIWVYTLFMLFGVLLTVVVLWWVVKVTGAASQ